MQHAGQTHVGTQVSLAVTLETMTELGKDLPTMVYSLTGLSGGLPHRQAEHAVHVALDGDREV